MIERLDLSKNVRRYIYFLRRRNELLNAHSLSDEADDLVLEMLDFVWELLAHEECEVVNSIPSPKD